VPVAFGRRRLAPSRRRGRTRARLPRSSRSRLSSRSRDWREAAGQGLGLEPGRGGAALRLRIQPLAPTPTPLVRGVSPPPLWLPPKPPLARASKDSFLRSGGAAAGPTHPLRSREPLAHRLHQRRGALLRSRRLRTRCRRGGGESPGRHTAGEGGRGRGALACRAALPRSSALRCAAARTVSSLEEGGAALAEGGASALGASSAEEGRGHGRRRRGLTHRRSVVF